MLTLFLMLFLGTARAGDDDTRARELYENGAILYDEGRYEDAVAAWNEAYRISQRPGLLYNIANAEERLGRYQDALDHLNRYRAFAEQNERDTLDRRIANLERRLAETTPPANNNTPVNPPATTEPPKKQGVSPLPFVFFGIGGASAITGGVFGGLAGGARADAKADCVDSGGSTLCPASAQTAIATDHRDSLVADICFGVAIASAAGGVITLVLPQNTALGATWLPGGGALSLKGRF